MKLRILVTALTACFASQAGITTFTNSAEYYAALSAKDLVAVIEGYESYSTDTEFDSGAFGDLTYTLPDGVKGRVDATYSKLGSMSLAAVRDGSPFDYFIFGETIGFVLPRPAHAVGIFINAPTTVSSTDLVLRTNTGGVATNGGPGNYDSGTLYFIGLIDDTPFTSFTLESILDVRGFNVDDISYSSVAHTPEPSTLALLASGLIAAAGLKRRRSS